MKDNGMTGVRVAASVLRTGPRRGVPPVGRPAPGQVATGQVATGQAVDPAQSRPVAVNRSGWPDRPVSGRAAADLAVNERARGEGARATERDARTAEYDWYETWTTPESAPYQAEQASREHAVADLSADLAAGHESNAGALAAQGYPLDTRAAVTAARGRGANTAARSSLSPRRVARSRPVPAR
jgi:hypothetical protein